MPVVLADVWKTTPFVALLLLAGLQNIDASLYEAARIDGASAWRQFRHVTLPLLKPAMLVALIFRTLDAFRVFDLVYVMTGGGPGTATEPIALYTFNSLLQNLRFGYGSALSVIVFAGHLRARARLHPVARRRSHGDAAREPRSRWAAVRGRAAGARDRVPVLLGHRLVAHARGAAVPGARRSCRRTLVLDHYRALFAERDFWVPDPQLADRRRHARRRSA